MDKIKGDHVIPLPGQKVLKLDRTFRADAPALAAAGAFGHIVSECSLAVLVANAQCGRGTILHAGQTPVAVLIYTKIRHF